MFMKHSLLFFTFLLLSFFQLKAQCDAGAGTFSAMKTTFMADSATISATHAGNASVPQGFQILFVLTRGESLVITGVDTIPSFKVARAGLYTIHTLVYNPTTLDLSIVQPGVTTGVDVNGLLVQGGGTICAALDVAGVKFEFGQECEAAAGTLTAGPSPLLVDGKAALKASIATFPSVPSGYLVRYVLTSGTNLVIQAVSQTPEFEVTQPGIFTIHTLVYDPSTLDLGIVQIGVTTGVDVNGLLQQGGGNICAALDVAGAKFTVTEDISMICEATAGTLLGGATACLGGSPVTIVASQASAPAVPQGFQRIYVLTKGENLVIQAVNSGPSFQVNEVGRYTIHTLVYDPATLDLGIVQFGVTTGVDVNGLLIQGGGSICAALDVAGAAFDVQACMMGDCTADAGTLKPVNFPCLRSNKTVIVAAFENKSVVPAGYSRIFVLTKGTGLVIQAVATTPQFIIREKGFYTIHTLVYDPATLDLGIVQFGQTTGFDVNALLVQGGGSICAALDVAGATFPIDDCADYCAANAGTLVKANTPCYLGAELTLKATHNKYPYLPSGYKKIYVLTKGEGLVIVNVSDKPEFKVNEKGRFTIHTLVYDPSTLNLGIVKLGMTTGADVNKLLRQGGGQICGSLDVKGAPFVIKDCKDDCTASAGSLKPFIYGYSCLKNDKANLRAYVKDHPYIPKGYKLIYVLTSGDGLVIRAVSAKPEFTIGQVGKYTIHTLVYDPQTLDLGIVQIGVTTGFDVNGLLAQGGGSICAALDVAGAVFKVENCSDHLFSVYPNPSSGVATLQFESKFEIQNADIEIVNWSGSVVHLVKNTNIGYTQDVDLSQLPAGSYIVRIVQEGTVLAQKTLVKQ